MYKRKLIMNLLIENKSDKTRERIEVLLEEIRNYRESIQLLKFNLNDCIASKSTPFEPRVIKYSAIPQCENRTRLTIQNITSQVLILERELAALIEFGA